MQTIGVRVQEAREAKGWSQKRLAEEVTRAGYKIGQSAIGNLESGKTKDPKCIVQLAAALNLAPRWIQTGKGEKVMRTPANINNPAERTLHAEVITPNGLRQDDNTLPPLLLWKSGRGVSGRQGGFLLTKEKAGEVNRPEFLRFSQNAFAYRVQDEANAPAYRTRDTVLVDPDAPIAAGDDCLFSGDQVSNPQIEAVAGQLVRSAGTDWIVRQYAAAGETKLPKATFPNAWLIVGRYNRR